MFFDKIIELNRKEGLYLKYLVNKGRGLFCKYDIKADEIIETTPSFVFNRDKDDFVRNGILRDYVFASCEISHKMMSELKADKEDHLVTLPLGISLFCNHDKDKNATYKQMSDDHSVYFQLIALRDIPKNTEICISYGENWFAIRKLVCD